MGTTSPKFQGRVTRSDAKRASTLQFHGRIPGWDQAGLTPSLEYGTTTDLFDLFWFRRGLDPESLNAYIVSIQSTFPNICESS